MIAELISKLENKKDLTYEEMSYAMSGILRGETTEQQTIDFLLNLTNKEETDDELLGMLDKMQEYSLKMEPKNTGTIIDVCGTGGDKLQTFNISTTSAFVVAAGGGIVAKHGNRSSSGISGSADIFEYFGYDLNQDAENISRILEEFNICFMFAQKFHPAMKNVAAARKQIGKRTAFNLLGPLSNPAGVKNQLIGVFSNDFLERLPLILKRKGSENIMTVRSDDGMDEFSTGSKNKVCLLRDGKILTNIIDPEILGLKKSSLKDIQIKSKKDAIKSFVSVLDCTANQAMIETTLLNSAAGLIVANVAKDFDEGIDIAKNSLESGKTLKLLEKFVKQTGDIKKLKEVQES